MQTALRIIQESPRQAGVIRLLEQSNAYAASLYPAESNHMLPLDEIEQQNVSFFVARAGDAILGCAALVGQGDGTGEIKRMFVDEVARGLKLGKLLLARLEEEALRRQIHILRLETGIYQPEAIGLYRKAGYLEIPPFGGYTADPLSLFMEKRLEAITSPASS
ncbi:GNAT family N-acetyltransferase [Rhizobium wuzhouense]|uniref:GNAT family N-acetyltransferase n=1 Tax=Rhizobium wuzhouense TaxID=1986026 RepID=A0ABX5NWN0_9HYPH|nr:GNAT family N-acetyltransferase [Rhizobium wuzhouense]PYB77024.1 GNAT family N-acetyltransferase [Rhizobium wuzhouense]